VVVDCDEQVMNADVRGDDGCRRHSPRSVFWSHSVQRHIIVAELASVVVEFLVTRPLFVPLVLAISDEPEGRVEFYNYRAKLRVSLCNERRHENCNRNNSLNNERQNGPHRESIRHEEAIKILGHLVDLSVVQSRIAINLAFI
jgi:hypothetical protein